MRVLVGCEESQEITKAFRARGHEAYSCDLKPCSGEHPEWHFQEDVLAHGMALLEGYWDLFIVHPNCDHLAVSGARWFPEKRKDGRQEAAIEFFLKMWESPIQRIAIENPVGIMSGDREYLKEHYPDLYERAKMLPEPQIIQPYEYGHPETKKTCLWLKNLPRLIPTNNVFAEMMRLPKKDRNRIHYMSPSPERSALRAKTYTGWANAMADQWGCL